MTHQNRRGFYMVDMYAGTIIHGGWLMQLDADHVTLAWQWQPNDHRCAVPRRWFAARNFKPHTFSGLSIAEATERGLLTPVRPCEPTERRAARLVRYGRVACAEGLRMPEIAGVVFDDLDGEIDGGLAVRHG